MKQLHVKFSDEEWKMLNEIFETRKNELEDAFMHKMTLTGTIKNAIVTSYMIHVDKNFTLIATPKEKEKPKNDTITDKKPKKFSYKSPAGGTLTFNTTLKPSATLKTAK